MRISWIVGWCRQEKNKPTNKGIAVEEHGNRLVPFHAMHIPALMRWIDSERQCSQWGGPGFRYPFDSQSFSEDCRWQELPSFALENTAGDLLAFGQFYNRLDHCHLGRLIVAPQARGQGIGQHLIRALVARGCGALNLQRCSLFVLKNNPRARALYEKLGFTAREYPESAAWLEGCDYLVTTVDKILDSGQKNEID